MIEKAAPAEFIPYTFPITINTLPCFAKNYGLALIQCFPSWVKIESNYECLRPLSQVYLMQRS